MSVMIKATPVRSHPVKLRPTTVSFLERTIYT
jgi:hypothetical protein